MPKHIPRPVALGITGALAVLALAGCSLQPDVSSSAPPRPQTSQPAPPLSGTTLDGPTVSLAGLRGHPVVLDFWASWCGPCRQQQNELNALATTYSGRGVRFVGVDIRDDRANARAYVQEFRVPYPSIFDPASDAAASFNVDAPPTTVVIDAGGTIRLRDLGTLADVPATLNVLLGSA